MGTVTYLYENTPKTDNRLVNGIEMDRFLRLCAPGSAAIIWPDYPAMRQISLGDTVRFQAGQRHIDLILRRKVVVCAHSQSHVRFQLQNQFRYRSHCLHQLSPSLMFALMP